MNDALIWGFRIDTTGGKYEITLSNIVTNRRTFRHLPLGAAPEPCRARQHRLRGANDRIYNTKNSISVREDGWNEILTMMHDADETAQHFSELISSAFGRLMVAGSMLVEDEPETQS
jgi:hypothetical protein